MCYSFIENIYKGTAMKKRIFIAFLVSIILFTSCSTSINVRRNRPAELDLSFAETIAVFPFSEEPDFWDYMFVGTDTYELANYFTKQLESKLAKSSYITLLDSEQSYNAIKNGKKPQCDIYISGKVYNLYTNIEEKEVNTKTENYFEYYRVLRYTISYSVVDAKTGEILDSYEKTFTNESTHQPTIDDVETSLDMAKSNLNSLATSLMKKLTPYTETTSITLLKDKSKNPQMKNALELVKDEQYNLAYDEYYDVYEKTGLFEAGYNAACILSVYEMYEDAEKLFLELYNNTGRKEALEALNDVRYEIKARNELLKQQGKN